MKLVIQIPCRNEEHSLPQTIADLPRSLPGVDEIAVLVIDDGSTDRTAAVATKLGAQVVALTAHRGLASAFSAGIDCALHSGADLIVNTDGDNQYRGDCVAALIAPLLRGEADIVIGARPIADIASFSAVKKILQRLGSWAIRRLSGSDVADATSGFRAITRHAALRLNVFSSYTYTLEMIVQAALRGLRLASVPITVNPPTRESRLVRSNLDYVWRTGSGVLRMFVVYRPFRSFMMPALVFLAVGVGLGLRFLYFYATYEGPTGHLQSLILAAISFGIAGVLMVVAFLGDLIAINRRLLEDVQLEHRRARLPEKLIRRE